MVVRWTLYDPVSAETYTMQINPNDGGSRQYKKNVSYQNTSAQDGNTLVHEGRDEPHTLEWSGVILEQQHLEDLIGWFNKRRQVRLTDDLGRESWIYITGLSPKRVRAATRPWKHEYSCSAIVVSWP